MANDSELAALLREIRDQQRDHVALQGRAGKALRLIPMIAIPPLFFLLALMLRPYLQRFPG